MKSTITGLGVNVDIHHFDKLSLDLYIKTLKTLGARWIRLELDLNKYSDGKNQEELIYFVNECKRNQIAIVGLLTHFIPASIKNILFPHWYHKSVTSRIVYFSHIIEDLVQKLKDHIWHWEVWNEQNSKRFWIDSPSPQGYVDFLRHIKTVIHAIQPHSKIIFGGINGNDITPFITMPRYLFQYTDFIKDCLALGASHLVDHIAFHPYVLSCYLSLKEPHHIANEIMDRIDETVHAYPDHSLMITEIGVSPVLNRKVDSKGLAAIYKTLIRHCEQHTLPICIYTLVDTNPLYYGRLNPDKDFGFLDYNLREKPLFSEFIRT